MTTYAVTGASGQLGRLVVLDLLGRDVPAGDIVAVVRTPSKAADLDELGAQVREADYSDQQALAAALAGVNQLLLVSSSVAGQRVAHHTNVIDAAKTAGVARIVYTSMLNADDTTNPLGGEHRDTERVLREAAVPFTLLRNGWYTENYADQLGQYLESGEVVGAARSGMISAATRHDYAAAAAAVLLHDEDSDQTFELGGPAFGLAELARAISEVTGTLVTYRDLPAEDYVSALRHTGLDEDTARFVAALDTSIAHGDLRTDSQDLARLLGRPATPLLDVVRAAHARELGTPRAAAPVIGFIGAGHIGAALAQLATAAGYEVVLSNSRSPDTLHDLVDQLGPHARAATPAEAAAAGDIVVVTVPFKSYEQIPPEPLAGKVVIDTNNYSPDRDGHITELDQDNTTSSELLQAHLPDSHVVKTFNSVLYTHLVTLSRPPTAHDRSAVAIAGDDTTAKQAVTAFLEAIGYDAYDAGALREGWRYQQGAIAYPYGSFDDPRPADAEHLAKLLARAERHHDL